MEKEMPPSTHERLLEIYKSFLVIGGMPEAVSAFLDTGSILESQKVHRDIVMNFMDDFQKYDSPVPPDVLKRVFDFGLFSFAPIWKCLNHPNWQDKRSSVNI